MSSIKYEVFSISFIYDFVTLNLMDVRDFRKRVFEKALELDDKFLARKAFDGDLEKIVSNLVRKKDLDKYLTRTFGKLSILDFDYKIIENLLKFGEKPHALETFITMIIKEKENYGPIQRLLEVLTEPETFEFVDSYGKDDNRISNRIEILSAISYATADRPVIRIVANYYKEIDKNKGSGVPC